MESIIAGVIVGVIISWIFFGLLGAWVASQKGRDETEGVLLGVLFGPFGTLIEALLPTIERPLLLAPSPREQLLQPSPEEQLLAQEALKRQETIRKIKSESIKKFEDQQWKQGQLLAQKAQIRRDERIRWRRELWNSTPDWLKMSVVGLIVGAVLSIPLFILFGPTSPSAESVRIAVPSSKDGPRDNT